MEIFALASEFASCEELIRRAKSRLALARDRKLSAQITFGEQVNKFRLEAFRNGSGGGRTITTVVLDRSAGDRTTTVDNQEMGQTRMTVERDGLLLSTDVENRPTFVREELTRPLPVGRKFPHECKRDRYRHDLA